MKQNKQNFIQFFTWMRNGIAFCISWFLILILIHNYFYNIPSVSTNGLIKLILFVIGGVFLFCSFFTTLFIKKWRFLSRLTCFMVLFSIYECIAFYCMGLFVENGTFAQWVIFVGIILALYLVCIAIYQLYSKQKGELYTQALQIYQKQRKEN